MGQYFMDQYSFIHFCTGAIAHYLGISFWHWFILHILFEISENTAFAIDIIQKYLNWWPGGKFFFDHPINSIGDQVFAMLGWLVAYQLNKWGEENNWHGDGYINRLT